jgi:adhesin HecA-like repeat protein
MAYPTVDKPYGLKPINLIGGQVYAGSTRLMAVASGEGTSIFYGDAVKLSGGYITRDPADSAMTPVGVFMGCTFTDPNTNQKVFKQYFPAGTVASDIQAYVVDDPDALFKVAVVSSGTTMSGVTQVAVGLNAALVDNTGSTITGDSAVAISATTATTNTLPVRVVDVVPDTRNSLGSYTEVIVKWNFGMHQYENATGA